jgi:hypothetical protein
MLGLYSACHPTSSSTEPVPAPPTDTSTLPADTSADTSGDTSADTSAPPDDTSDTSDTPDTSPPPDPCAGFPLCDGFEGGDTPDADRWELLSPDCSGSGTVTVDTTVAHGGTRSIRVDGGGGYCDHVFLRNRVPAALPSPLYARFFVRFAAALGDSHVSFLAMPDAADGGSPIRMGGQSGIFMWNRASDDATLPVLSPTGIATSTAPVPEAWTCVEFALDGASLTTWVDGVAVPGLAADTTATPDADAQWVRGGQAPAPTSFALGWESYAGQSMTLWFDDVVIAGAPIGCG